MKESGNNREKEELCRKIRKTAAERCREFTPNKCKETKNVNVQELRNNGRSHKTIYLGWLHAIKTEGRYKSVRLANGGGVRRVTFHYHDNIEKILNTAKQIFFPNSQNSFGTLTLMSAKLGNFQREPITECTISIQNYIKKHYLSKTHLYLLMSVKSSQEVIKGILDDDGSDFESLPSLKPLSTNDTILNIGKSSLLGALRSRI